MLIISIIVLLVLTSWFDVTCASLLSEEINGLNLNDTRCLNQCLNLNSTLLFYPCMENCSSSWLFGQKNSCNVFPSDTPTCNVRTFEIKTLKRKLASGEVVQHVYLSWAPCPIAIVDLIGYAIIIKSTGDRQRCSVFYLQQKALSRLRENKNNMKIWFVDPEPIANGKSLRVEMLAVPYHDDEEFLFIESFTKSCHSLNGPHSCFCEHDILDPPNITVVGYSVEVTFQPALDCFSPTFYDVYLHSSKSKFCRSNIYFCDKIRIGQPQNESTPLRVRFDNVFNSDSSHLFLKITTVYNGGRPISSRLYPVTITAWLPPEPVVTELGSGEYEARFSLPAAPFRVPSYMFKIRKCKLFNSSLETVSILRQYDVSTESAVDGVLHQRLYLDKGLYCVQIKEIRNATKNADKFAPAQWGPVKTIFVKESPFGSHIYPIAIVVGCLTLICVSILIFIFLLINGHCKSCTPYIPDSWNKYIMKPPPSPTRKTVLLVWQCDFRSQVLNDLYKEVVRSFGSFLAVECGLEVILDMCEEIDMSSSYANWISKSVEKTDVVVFVCPHFDYSKFDKKLQASVGNFVSAFSYMEKDMMIHKQNYVCVLFPFADVNLTSHTKFLHKMVATYNIMEKIEDFYFRIQGISKISLYVKKTAGNISKSRYKRTEAGRDLHERMVRFDSALKEFVVSHPCSSDSNDNDESCSSMDWSDHQDPGQGGDFYSISTNKCDCESFADGQSIPLVVSFFSELVPPKLGDSPVQQTRSKLEPIVPLTENPIEVIRRLNEKSLTTYYMSEFEPQHTSYPSHLCQVCCEDHRTSCVSLSSQSSSCMDISCFHTNELDSVSVSSCRANEVSPNKDELVNETSPKSLMGRTINSQNNENLDIAEDFRVHDPISFNSRGDSGIHSNV